MNEKQLIETVIKHVGAALGPYEVINLEKRMVQTIDDSFNALIFRVYEDGEQIDVYTYSETY